MTTTPLTRRQQHQRRRAIAAFRRENARRASRYHETLRTATREAQMSALADWAGLRSVAAAAILRGEVGA
jgi:hypothetical protein